MIGQGQFLALYIQVVTTIPGKKNPKKRQWANIEQILVMFTGLGLDIVLTMP